MPFKDREVARERQKEYSRRWYLKNREDQIRKSKITKRKKRQVWEDYKAKQKCSHCGAKHPAIIDFHHIIRKNKRSVNKLATIRSNVPEAIKEAETKCIPLCSNCHRIHHWKEHKRKRKRLTK